MRCGASTIRRAIASDNFSLDPSQITINGLIGKVKIGRAGDLAAEEDTDGPPVSKDSEIVKAD